ncbi:DUF1501 domain-containing protein [Pirellulaceae bacterium]|jgi:hypothetical protein|nr:DUF1501 domain-containing protein [Pirellulaceae bacterium]MDB4640220.1 DUF1501 domain-containing protein [Pirellulaceae bacterium]
MDLNRISRRDALRTAGTGLGLLAIPTLLQAENQLAPKASQFPAKAKHIIHVYLNGGPSQVDTWDPKPELNKRDGQRLPIRNLTTERETGVALGSPFKFKQYGQSGLKCSDVFDKTAHQHADKICVIRSMYANTPNHEQSMRLMNTGDERLSRPSYGSWLTYGLGCENQNLPGFVTLCPGLPVADSSNWRSSFLPGIYQGTYLDTRKTRVEELIANIHNSHLSPTKQRIQLDLLSRLNRQHQQTRSEDPNLEARIQSFELAYRMQMEASDALDISKETAETQALYGADTVHGRQLLIARRLVERGVRVVQCYHGDVQPWDSHDNIGTNHKNLGNQADGPIAALLTDLERKGLLDDTLVLCGGEFGRTPAVEIPIGGGGKPTGRDHNHHGFSVWLAGGGIKGGMTYGATDEFGYAAVENRTHVHDLHATMLHLMGFDHEKLTYRHAGRDYRLTDVHGKLVKEILA